MEKLTGWGFNSQLDACSTISSCKSVESKRCGRALERLHNPKRCADKAEGHTQCDCCYRAEASPPMEPSPSSDSEGAWSLQSEHIFMILKGVSDHLKDNTNQATVTILSPNKEVKQFGV